eukprot:1336736-Amorphochlora_amoeboformis.AAC.1
MYSQISSTYSAPQVFHPLPRPKEAFQIRPLRSVTLPCHNRKPVTHPCHAYGPVAHHCRALVTNKIAEGEKGRERQMVRVGREGVGVGRERGGEASEFGWQERRKEEEGEKERAAATASQDAQ